MKTRTLVAAALFLALPLGACHTDPFGLKPEVKVTLPDTPAPEAEAPAKEPEDGTPPEVTQP
ncbi:MAG: hypothetical protein KDA53_08130 [Hyphomonas sp.]|nr:hypothetical protein [Hyphomonas sp.]